MLERWNNRSSYPADFQAQIRRYFQFEGGPLPNGESEGRVVFEQLMAGYSVGTQSDRGYEYTIDAWLEKNGVTVKNPGLLFPDNKERIALISLAYQGWIKLDRNGNPVGCPSLAKALANDDRAEAWYEIRYNTNREGRRYSESELFGLYNDIDNVGEDDAKAAYRMLTRHQGVILGADDVAGTIDDYERLYPPGSRSNPINVQLESARNYLVTNFVDFAGIPISVNWCNIYIGEHDGSTPGSSDTRYYRNTDADTLTGTNQSDLMFGESGADTLNGAGGDDVLYGGTGNDLLRGGEGHDYYMYATGDGRDTLTDSDNEGEIRFNDVALDGGTKLVGVNGEANGVFRSADQQTYYIRYNDFLFITQTPNDDPGNSEGIVVEGYADGALNLTFNPARPEPETVNTVDYNLEEPGSPTADNDLMIGTDTAEAMSGRQGDDILRGNGGNDSLWGDDQSTVGGDDFLYGGAGEDFLEGEAGDDFLDGGEDNDILLGDYRSEDRGHDTLLGGAGRDNLAGFYGIDWLDGGEGNDLLGGGAGMDFVLGGAGDDILFGDDNPEAARGWTVTVAESNVNPYNGLALSRSLSFTGVFLGLPPPADQHGDVLAGGSGDDYLAGNGGNDTLLGEADSDFLLGGNGDDLLIGGTGNDILKGEAGADTYLINPNDGIDVIYSYWGSGQGLDVLRFGEGITKEQLLFNRTNGSDLLIDYGTGKVAIWGWYGGLNWQLGAIQLADGTASSPAQASSLGINTSHQYSYTQGTGTQTIQDWGGGADSLVFGPGTLPSDVIVQRSGSNLVLSVSAGAQSLGAAATSSTDQVVFTNWFGNAAHLIETITFADGTVWSGKAITEPFLTVTGSDTANDNLYGVEGWGDTLSGLGGDDRLYGYGGDDTLVGGAGNDILYGGNGNDVYRFAKGDGQDSIEETGGYDVLRISGYDPSAITTRWSGTDLVFEFTGSSDRITLTNQNSSSQYKVDAYRVVTSGSNAGDTITAPDFGTPMFEYEIYGLAGSDTLTGSRGMDTLDGGDGNDVLDGGGCQLGFDTFIGGAGDDILGGAPGSNDWWNFGNVYRGGTGNDLLRGTRGTDKYYFDLGDGHDVIDDPLHQPAGYPYSLSNGGGRLILGSGVSPSAVKVERVGVDLKISISANDSVTVRNWYLDTNAPTNYGLSSVEFSDGTVWLNAEITQKGLTQVGTAGNDVLEGTSLGDRLLGQAGDDTLNGYWGADELDGGVGNRRPERQRRR
ncbi:MAG: hypothetical protein MZW92_50760 [Comamonadaceae bacterium]|nr:hypothetical protein [Comamonadaceae bacterium]